MYIIHINGYKYIGFIIHLILTNEYYIIHIKLQGFIIQNSLLWKTGDL